MIKKITAIGLLAIFVFNTCGYLLAFHALQLEIRSQMRSRINSGQYISAFTLLHLSNEQLPAINDNELNYAGIQYDIIATKKTLTGADIYCLCDNDEMTLLSMLDTHIKTNVSGKRSDDHSKKIADNVVKLFFNKGLSQPTPQITDFRYNLFEETFCSAIRAISTPPPELA